MKCPLCKGSGECREITEPKKKAEMARILRREGFSYRTIANALGWKSTHSVTHSLKTK